MGDALDLKSFGYIAGAMLLGGAIGFERELADKPAGMRTHMLVAGAAAMFVFLADMLVTKFAGQFGEVIRSDPVRLIEAIATGVAFLGAGTIIRHGNRNLIQGLTTAATLLFTAAIGICVGLKHILLALGATVLVLLTLRIIPIFEARFMKKENKSP